MASPVSYLGLLVVGVLQAVNAAVVPLNGSLDAQWENFKRTYNRAYSHTEEVLKRRIFEDNLAKINSHNDEYERGLHTYQRGLNEFADMAAEEFLKKMTGYKSTKKTPAKPTNQPVEFDLPESVDWRKAGAVTQVKNQQQCGSCYAFAATGSLEGQQKIKKGKLVSLSEQNIVDCSGPEGNLGCEGGNMDFSYRYIAENGGIDTEKSYPYEAVDGTCRYKKNGLGATAKGYADIPPTEDHLKMAVALVGPISCGIDAGHDSFQLYQGGIYNEPNCSSENLDHAVTVIGYGSENGQDYWLCKNSWGTSWGENGFIKMSRNKGNQCGIATEASYPLI